jgi:hypothetical protein
LPAETRDYILTIARHPVEDWIGDTEGRLAHEQTREAHTLQLRNL